MTCPFDHVAVLRMGIEPMCDCYWESLGLKRMGGHGHSARGDLFARDSGDGAGVSWDPEETEEVD